MGYVRPKRAKRPANRPKWPSHSFRRRVWATCFFEILDPGAFDEHFFNGLLKVGFTDRTPAHRVSELGATGLPFPYVVVYAVQVARGRLVEKEVHQRLSRYHASKEWFCCSVEAAKSAIREVVGNYGCGGGSPLVPGHALVPFFSGAEEMDGSPDIDEDDDDESPYPPGHPMRGLL